MKSGQQRFLPSFVLAVWAALMAEPGAQAQSGFGVEIVEPAAGVPLFDQVEVAVRITGTEAVDRLEVLVDGRNMGAVEAPPWRLLVDVGSLNREHLIEVVARGHDGSVARSKLLSPSLQVHETVELALQQLYLTVTGPQGARVVDLDEGRFSVRDDGRRQQIVTLAGGEIPFTAVLLVDSSGSMGGPPLAAALRGASRFVTAMAEYDEARVLLTSDRVFRSSPWIDDPTHVTPLLGNTHADGGSAILDHLFLALQLLEERQGRRVLILLSDGWDQHSALTLEQLRRVSRHSQAMIYWVRIGSQPPENRGPSRNPHSWVEGNPSLAQGLVRIPLSVWRDRSANQEVAQALETMVEESGGRIVPITHFGQVEAAFVEILEELREQIAIGYYPDPRRQDGSWRQVKVKVEGRGLEVRTRKGYIDRP